mmetsp:Transcript_11394/g.7900  ORF Transcript_11394/g.7900 Transcript_11394/m.7900 type:complete len:245 (+) Transcript_11394:179-913(+)
MLLNRTLPTLLLNSSTVVLYTLPRVSESLSMPFTTFLKPSTVALTCLMISPLSLNGPLLLPTLKSSRRRSRETLLSTLLDSRKTSHLLRLIWLLMNTSRLVKSSVIFLPSNSVRLRSHLRNPLTLPFLKFTTLLLLFLVLFTVFPIRASSLTCPPASLMPIRLSKMLRVPSENSSMVRFMRLLLIFPLLPLPSQLVLLTAKRLVPILRLSRTGSKLLRISMLSRLRLRKTLLVISSRSRKTFPP